MILYEPYLRHRLAAEGLKPVAAVDAVAASIGVLEDAAVIGTPIGFL